MSRFVAASFLVGGAAAALESEFAQFVQTYNKQYASAQEMQERFETFKRNRLYQEKENAKQSTYTMGVNEFSDLSSSEFSESRFGYTTPKNKWGGLPKVGVHQAMDGEVAADSIDWVEIGAVTPVKNQGQCGSCWSFSTTGAIEGAWAMATGNLVSLSEQQFVDCSKENHGCNGGNAEYAFEFAEGQAICTEETYPYHASESSCAPGGCTVGVPSNGVTGYTDVDQTEAAFVSALNNQPVSIAIEADKDAFMSYTSGVLQELCGTQLDHGVLAVGYGSDNGVEYWKVKNSWGGSWGESGYIRLLRGKGGMGECGILAEGSYPQVNGNWPSPTPAPTPPAPAESNYQEPPCNSQETEFSVDNGDVFCSPQCDSSNACPAATTGTATCGLAYQGANYCVDQCGSDADCPSGATCDDLGFVYVCAFIGSATEKAIALTVSEASTITV